MIKALRRAAFAKVAFAAVILASAPALPASAPSAGEPAAPMRRLTPEQYANIIEEVFGNSVELGGRFEPDMRVEHLNEVGSGKVSVSSTGMAQYNAMARTVAKQVTHPANRHLMIPCTPASAKAADDACAKQFLSRTGRLLFRRPMTEREVGIYVRAANVATASTGDFYTGLSLSLSSVLSSPQFLFRQATIEADPDNKGQVRLDSFAKATRLSFFLWNSMPDEELLVAAEKGELRSRRGLERQVARMIASPRLEKGVRAFFADMFQLDDLASLSKDSTIYPKYDAVVAKNAREQTLRTILDLVVDQKGDYRDLFRTRKTYLTQALASLYQVKLINDIPNGSPDTWQEFTFAPNDPRTGLLTHLSFVGLHSNPGRTSATLRGKALREIVMCQKVPAPPDAVDFAVVQDTSNPVHRTARDRLTAHQANPVCAGCHKLTDPMGLALENFDGSGAFRTKENGVEIDTAGQLDNVKFNNAAELGQAVYNHPATTSCVVNRLAAYGLGRPVVLSDREWIGTLTKEFAAKGHIVPALMQAIATSSTFFQAEARPPITGEREAGN